MVVTIGGSRISQGAPNSELRTNLSFSKIFAEKCMKKKEIEKRRSAPWIRQWLQKNSHDHTTWSPKDSDFCNVISKFLFHDDGCTVSELIFRQLKTSIKYHIQLRTHSKNHQILLQICILKFLTEYSSKNSNNSKNYQFCLQITKFLPKVTKFWLWPIMVK